MNTGRIVTLSIAKHFSRWPAGRFQSDGRFNGERFRQEHLVPALRRLGSSDRLQVVFDELEGAGSSFLEEAFGGLVRVEGFEKSFLDAHLEPFTSEPRLRDFVVMSRKHIERAAQSTR